MIILPLVVVLVVVAVVEATRHRHTHAMTTGNTQVGAHHAKPVSSLGRLSLVSLAAGLLLRALTFTTAPVHYAATLGGISFVLAVVAAVRSHDRSPLLLIPLLFVPIAAIAGALFVWLQ